MPLWIIRFNKQTSFWNLNLLLPSWFPQRRLGGRIALITEIAAGETTIRLYNLHLESRGPGYTRYAQLKEVLADTDRVPASTPIVLAGDLNTKYAVQTFVDLLTRHRFHNCFGEEHPRTHRLIGSLDWIFVRGKLSCEAPQVH